VNKKNFGKKINKVNSNSYYGDGADFFGSNNNATVSTKNSSSIEANTS